MDFQRRRFSPQNRLLASLFAPVATAPSEEFRAVSFGIISARDLK